MSLLACGQSTSGQLSIRVAFPFRVAAIPDNTEAIHILVRQGDRKLMDTELTRANPSIVMTALPAGPTEVIAVAFDGSCTALASAKGQVQIQPSTINRVELNLGSLDRQLADLAAADCTPKTAPTAPASETSPIASTPAAGSSSTIQPPATIGGTTNSAPSVSLTVSETTVAAGMPLTLKAAVSDRESAPAAMTYTWTATPNVGSFTGSTTTTSTSAFRTWIAPQVAGSTSVTLTVTVTDGSKQVTSNSVNITVNPVATGSVLIGGNP